MEVVPLKSSFQTLQMIFHLNFLRKTYRHVTEREEIMAVEEKLPRGQIRQCNHEINESIYSHKIYIYGTCIYTYTYDIEMVQCKKNLTELFFMELQLSITKQRIPFSQVNTQDPSRLTNLLRRYIYIISLPNHEININIMN